MTGKELEKKIKKFIKDDEYSEYETRLKDGYFIYLKKVPFNNGIMLDIHTPGYDGVLPIDEAINWLSWTIYDYEANGLL